MPSNLVIKFFVNAHGDAPKMPLVNGIFSGLVELKGVPVNNAGLVFLCDGIHLQQDFLSKPVQGHSLLTCSTFAFCIDWNSLY